MSSRPSRSFIRIFFTADIHNSEQVFRKIFNVPSVYDPDVVIISGDLTGKAIVPVIDNGDGTFACTFEGKRYEIRGSEELKAVEDMILSRGFYAYRCSRQEVEELSRDQRKLEELFKRLMIQRIAQWVAALEEKMPKDVMVIMSPGNDDILDIDAVIRSSERVIYPLGKSVEIGMGYEVLSLDHVNPTPWNTPREASEDRLWEMLEDLASMVRDASRAICNFHCPPYNTNIDLAPKLDKKLRPVYRFGELEMQHVGCRAVRKFMERYSPVLGLHGHIHEAEGFDRVKKTLVLNPGSQYSAGVLKGVIVDLDRNGIVRWFRVG